VALAAIAGAQLDSRRFAIGTASAESDPPPCARARETTSTSDGVGRHGEDVNPAMVVPRTGNTTVVPGAASLNRGQWQVRVRVCKSVAARNIVRRGGVSANGHQYHAVLRRLRFRLLGTRTTTAWWPHLWTGPSAPLASAETGRRKHVPDTFTGADEIQQSAVGRGKRTMRASSGLTLRPTLVPARAVGSTSPRREGPANVATYER